MVFIKPSFLTTIHSRAFQHQTQFSPGGVKWEISGKSYCQLDADTKRPIWDFVDIGREPNWQFRNLSNIRNPPEDQKLRIFSCNNLHLNKAIHQDTPPRLIVLQIICNVEIIFCDCDCVIIGSPGSPSLTVTSNFWCILMIRLYNVPCYNMLHGGGPGELHKGHQHNPESVMRLTIR